MIKYPALVKQEAKNLKKFATKEELEKLDLKVFDPSWPNKCVYGLLCGLCYNERATELIEKCATRVYKSGYMDWNTNKLSIKLNGSPKGLERSKYWSPIENFIHENKNRTNGANERLIKYLKGEIKRL